MKGSLQHRFVFTHRRIFSKIYGHAGCGPDPRLEVRPPFLPLKVEVPEDFPEKTALLSVIASSLKTLPGHRARNSLIDSLTALKPGLSSHTFGRGRIPLDRKELGLDPYMYSLAIENSREDSYVTEKILDCFVRGVVPVYFGALDAREFFPDRSFIELPSLDPVTVKEVLDNLSAEDYQSRIPALREAADWVLTSNSLCCELSRQANLAAGSKASAGVLLPDFGILGARMASMAIRPFRIAQSRGSKAHKGSTA